MTETVELRNGEKRRIVEVRRGATCSFVSYRDPETGYDYIPYVWARMGWHPTIDGVRDESV